MNCSKSGMLSISGTASNAAPLPRTVSQVARICSLSVAPAFSNPIAFRFNAPGHVEDKQLGASVRREVFLIFKEAVNNIVKHSQCSEVRLERPVLTELRAQDTLDAEQLLARKQLRQWLDVALDALPLEQRTVFVLHELEGFSIIEIAQLIEAPAGTVASRLARAREKFCKNAARLRSLWNQHRCEGEEP